MGRASWMTYGFWLVTGLSLGMLISDLTRPPVAEAAVASRYDEYCIATGRSFDGEIDICWVLDYKFGLLHCMILSRDGLLSEMGRIDLVEQLELEGGKRIKPHFMMVTGRFETKRTDFCYLVETETGQILCIEPPLVEGAQRGSPQIPRVISRFRFRRTGD